MIEEIATLDHINVLPLIWTTIEPGRFTMVSPWAEKGTLTSYVDDMRDRLTDVQILTLVRVSTLTLFTRVECSSPKIRDVAAGLHYRKQHYTALLCYLAERASLTVHSKDILHGSLSGVRGSMYPYQFTHPHVQTI